MEEKGKIKLIAIGGSAGCLPVIINILKSIPEDFSHPIVIIVHRQRNVTSEMANILNAANPYKEILEPDDKAPVCECCVYLAPQNYHLLIEHDHTFSLDYSEAVKYSRPSIDVTFESAAQVYKDRLVAVLLSGANNDGTSGLISVVENGGIAVAQHPSTAEYAAMPLSAVDSVPGIKVLRPEEISNYLNNL